MILRISNKKVFSLTEENIQISREKSAPERGISSGFQPSVRWGGSAKPGRL
jgi:hypothetical protein